MKKLTKPQQAIIDRMKAGETLQQSRINGEWHLAYIGNTTVQAKTLYALKITHDLLDWEDEHMKGWTERRFSLKESTEA